MKKLPLLVVCCLFFAVGARGQTQRIELCIELNSYWCEYVDNQAALVPVYAVHLYSPGAIASRWMIAESPGFNCSYVGELIESATYVGDTQTGISVAYGLCLTGTFLVATVNYFCEGLNPACQYLEVVPDLGAPSGVIEVVDCSFVTVAGTGGVLIFNNDGSCPCFRPTKTTSWGMVKSLFE